MKVNRILKRFGIEITIALFVIVFGAGWLGYDNLFAAISLFIIFLMLYLSMILEGVTVKQYFEKYKILLRNIRQQKKSA